MKNTYLRVGTECQYYFLENEEIFMHHSRYSELMCTHQLAVKHSWFMHILLGIDQLGNALAAGNHDNTISARIGYFSLKPQGKNKGYWRVLEFLVNITFYPVDGVDHCRQAFLADPNEVFKDVGWLSIIILPLITVPVTIALIPVIYILAAIFPFIRNKYQHQGEEITLKEINEMRKIACKHPENVPTVFP